MHPYVLLVSHLYLSDLRREAEATHLATLRMASDRREAGGRAAPGRLARLRRALGSVSGRAGAHSLDLSAAA